MSIISTSANYGGKVSELNQNVKQFYVSGSEGVSLIYKNLTPTNTVITPSNPTKQFYINNDLIVTGSIYNPSDEKLKTNIINIPDKKKKMLLSLNPVEYNFRNDANKQLHYGLLAQEVESLYPELVGKNKITGHLTVNYQELNPIMLGLVQDLNNDVKIMQKFINDMDNKYNALMEKYVKLENSLANKNIDNV